MTTELTTREAHAVLVRYFNARRDLGLWKAFLDVVLDPQNPFEPKRREPRRAFVLAAVLISLPLAALFYFNC